MIIDQRLPDAAWGSGFGRMMEVVKELADKTEVSFLLTGGGDRSAVRKFHPAALLIYDIEALWHRRLLRQILFADDPEESSALKRAALSMELVERRIMGEADQVICLSTDELEIVRDWGCGKAALVSPLELPEHYVGSGFSSREGILFAAAWAAGPIIARRLLSSS